MIVCKEKDCKHSPCTKNQIVYQIILLGVIAQCAIGQSQLPVQLTAEEPAGVARDNKLVSGGIPLPAGISSATGFSLTNSSGIPVPAQFTPLSLRADGSINWLLVDALAKVDAGKSETFMLSTGTSPKPATPIAVTSEGKLLVVNTGPLLVKIDTSQYNFLEEVWLNGKKVVATDKTKPNVTIVNAIDKTTYSSGKPSSVEFEYNGPVKAVLKIKGNFVLSAGVATDPNFNMQYLTRLTFVAGSASIKIDHFIVNSNILGEYNAIISQSRLEVPLSLTGSVDGIAAGEDSSLTKYPFTSNGSDSVYLHQTGPRAGNLWWRYATEARGYTVTQNGTSIGSGNISAGWMYVGQSGLGACLLDPHFEQAAPRRIGLVPGNRMVYENIPPSSGKDVDYYSKSAFSGKWVGDNTHEGCHIHLDFLSGIQDLGSLAKLRKANIGWMHLHANTSWYSDLQAMGADPIPTIDDEIKVYNQWGWAKNEAAIRGISNKAHIPDAYFFYVDIHGSSEGDDLMSDCLEYVRTGYRGFLDQAGAVGRYYSEFALERTDGFDFGVKAGKAKLSSAWENTTIDHDALLRIRAIKELYGPGRFNVSHNYGAGLIDYYLLTGDREYMDASIDYSEWAIKYGSGTATQKYVPGDSIKNPWDNDILTASGEQRGIGRMIRGLSRIYEITRLPWIEKDLTTMVKTVVRHPYKNEMGTIGTWEYALTWTDPIFNTPWANKLKDSLHWVKGTDYPLVAHNFQSSILFHAIWHYYKVTGDEEAKDFCLGMAYGTAKYYLHKDVQAPFFFGVLDFPAKGRVWFNNIDPVGDDYNNIACADYIYLSDVTDILSRGYALTGDQRLLDRAAFFWGRSQPGYIGCGLAKGEFFTKSLPMNVVGVNPNPALMAPHDHDSFTHVAKLLFYFASHPKKDPFPPLCISDLTWTASGDNVKLTWTAPPDSGGGKVMKYHIKYDTLDIVDFYDFDAEKDSGKKRNWWFAKNVPNPPAPAAPNTKQEFTIPLPQASKYRFAIVAEDDAGNVGYISKSNYLVDARLPLKPRMAPGPDLKFTINADAGRSNIQFVIQIPLIFEAPIINLSIFNSAGRLVSNVVNSRLKPGSYRINWNAQSSSGKKVARGVFFAELKFGNLKTLSEPFVIIH